MMFIILFSLVKAFAGQPSHWSHLIEISERHEFYKNHEIIIKPKDSWQSLFGLVYMDLNFQRLKDCVFYRVPGIENGRLKIITIAAKEKCDDFTLKEADQEYHDIKSLQFSTLDNELKLDFGLVDFSLEKWTGHFQSPFIKPTPQLYLSSAEFKAPKIILLANGVNSRPLPLKAFPKEGSVCHDINEDCEEISPSQCNDCQNGWYEVPNGCTQGPKYCGRHQCGKKGQPACRRGMIWQKTELSFECRLDSSFAYCSKGLTVQCGGKKAYCR